MTGLRKQPVPVWWWTRKPTYFLFVMRELSSIFVAWYIGFLLAMVHAVSNGPAAYERFVDDAGAWWVVLINVVAFVFIVLHTITWFQVTPNALPNRVRGHPIPPSLILGSQYAGLVVVTGLIALAVLR